MKREERITVEELGNSSFTFQFFEQGTMEKAVKNVANVVHSVDSYVLRSLLRRCSYDPVMVNAVDALLCASLLGGGSQQECDEDHPAYGHIVRYGYTQLADIAILQYLDEESVECLSEAHKQALRGIIETMLVHTPFSVLTIHDDFRTHVKYLNHLRKHYRNILADIADSELCSDLLSQLYGYNDTFEKLSPDLSKYIRQSEYALC